MAGELTWLLKDEFSRSHNQSRKTIVMMDATWCSACKQFIQLAKKPVLRTALKAVTIVAVDVDEWGGSALREAGFSVKKIPSFFRIRASGYPRGKPLTPAAWPSNKPERAAEAFRKFLEDDSSF